MCNKSCFIIAADVMCSASDFSNTANTHSVNLNFKNRVPIFIHFFMVGNLGHMVIDFWVLNETNGFYNRQHAYIHCIDVRD